MTGQHRDHLRALPSPGGATPTRLLTGQPPAWARPPWNGASGPGHPGPETQPMGYLQPVIAVTVAVGDHAPPGSEAAARLQATLAYLRLKVELLRQRGQLDRVSDETLAMLPALRRHTRTTAKLIIADAVDLLCPKRDPWEPAPDRKAAAS